MSVRGIVIAVAPRVKGPFKPLAIKNPVAGQSGIYDIYADDGSTFKAYVDMATDGGYWILLNRWTGATNQGSAIPAANQIQQGKSISGFTIDPTNYPTVPAGKIAKNPSKQFLIQSEHPTWKSLFGNWQRASTFLETDTAIKHNVGFPVVTPLGNKTLHGFQTGWNADTPLSSTHIGFWTQAGNQGPCGGANREGPDRCCVVMPPSNAAFANHSDLTQLKRLYLRAVNFPG